jgi:hypothetical protein
MTARHWTWSRRMAGAVLGTALLLGTSPMIASAQENPLKEAMKKFCEKDLSESVLTEVATIFDRWPLNFKPASMQPHQEARKRLYGTTPLTNDVRKKMCSDPAKFGNKLKQIFSQTKAQLQQEYRSEDALVQFQMTKGQDLLKAMQG